MQNFFLVALGGALGAVLRYSMSFFPWGTVIVNLTGCFLIGLLWGVCNIFEIGNNWRIFAFTGFLGAFTTFSTFALENFFYFREGNISMLASNVLISNIVGIGLVFVGFYLSKLALR